MTNADILDMIRAQSSDFNGDLDAALKKAALLMKFSGFESRQWMADEDNMFLETIACAKEAIAGVKTSDIENVVYVGVGKHFQEPASASLLAKTLGLHQAHCFDVCEACASWARALFLLEGMYKAGMATGKSLVINCEVNNIKGGSLSSRFGLREPEDMEFKLPGYTIGDAITATVFEPDDQSHDWSWRTNADYADLCYVPMFGAVEYHETGMKHLDKIAEFVSYGKDLHEMMAPVIDESLKDFKSKNKNAVFEPDHIFTHGSSKKFWKKLVQQAGYDQDKLRDLSSTTGNLVSASIPAGISVAAESGVLKRGDEALIVVGSAGGSTVTFRMTY